MAYVFCEYAPDEYRKRLAGLDNGLSESENEKLKELYKNVVLFEQMKGTLEPLEAKQNAEIDIESDWVFFVQAKGDFQLAYQYYEQCTDFVEYSHVDFDRLFSGKDGFPNTDLKAEEVATNEPQSPALSL